MFLKKEFLLSFFTCIVYAMFFYLFQLFAHRAGYFTAVPSEGTLIGFWDAGWYHSIVENGYRHSTDASNTAFFILLPAIWKLSHLGGLGMSLLNVFFFGVGFGIMGLIFRPSVKDRLLWLTIPTMFFMFVPYTEALFFLLVSIIFYGVVQNAKWFIAIGFFFMALLRPTVMFVIPAALMMQLLTEDKRSYGKILPVYLVYYLLPAVVGMGLFCWYQYVETGVWFGYFYQQSHNWSHEFSMPAFPFSTIDGNRTLWINAFAVFIAFVSFIFIVVKFVKWLSGKTEGHKGKLFILSISYMAATLVYAIFFNPKWVSHLTIISAICRYILATPFFIVVLQYFTREREYRVKDFVVMIILANVVWLSFGSYNHIQQLIFYNFNTLLIALYMLSASKRFSWATTAIIALNFFIQATMFQQGMNGLYPE